MADAAAKGAEDMAVFMSGVLDSLQANVFLCDPELRIVAINARARAGLRRLSAEIREGFGVDAEQVIGLSISRFFHEPARTEAILSDPGLLPYDAEIALGSAVYKTRIDALRAPEGGISGYAVVCEDVTRLRAAERELRSVQRQRATLLREVHGRVGGSLRMIAELMRLESAAPESAARAAAWIERLRSIERVHGLIYDGDDVSRVDLDAFVRGLLKGVAAEHAAPPARVKIETAVSAEIRDLDRLIAFGLALGELASNSIKHAFPGGRSGCLRVTARNADGRVQAVVSDDGVGLPPGAARAGFGLRLLSALIERELKGEWKIESRGGGMACLFSFPS